MKLYERSLKTQMVFTSMSLLISTIQLILNLVTSGPPVIIAIFGITFGVFLILSVIICIDLVQNDPIRLDAQVVHLEEYQIHILKPKGKIMKVRVKATEYEQFQLNQTVELVVGKRTGSLLSICSKDETILEEQ